MCNPSCEDAVSRGPGTRGSLADQQHDQPVELRVSLLANGIAVRLPALGFDQLEQFGGGLHESLGRAGGLGVAVHAQAALPAGIPVSLRRQHEPADGQPQPPRLVWRLRRTPSAPEVSPEKTQGRQEAQDALHLTAAARPGEQVQGEAVPLHLREGRIFQEPEAVRDPGEDLVPEPQGKVQASPRSRNRQSQTCLEPRSGFGGPLRDHPAVPAPGPLIVPLHAIQAVRCQTSLYICVTYRRKSNPDVHRICFVDLFVDMEKKSSTISL